jgi:hypothetical protein
MMEEGRKKYEMEVKMIKDMNEEVIKKINIENSKNIENVENKYISLLKLEKKEKINN